MPANGHFASRLHGAPAGVARVYRLKFSAEVDYLADCALLGGPSMPMRRVRFAVVPEEGCPWASCACEGDAS